MHTWVTDMSSLIIKTVIKESNHNAELMKTSIKYCLQFVLSVWSDSFNAAAD